MKTNPFRKGFLIAAVTSALLLQPIALVILHAAGSEAKAQAQELVNVNQGSSEDLQRVKGIGPVLAERIIAYRDANGKFKTLDQLKEVKGLGTAKFEKIKGQVTV